MGGFALLNKDLIRQRFSRNIRTYNENAKIQKQMAQKLVTLLDNKSYDNILEIGCGTGILTELVSQKLIYKRYIANDIVPECEYYISGINKDIQFIQSDMYDYINSVDEYYDLIISNAAFQWIENFETFIKKLMASLKPNGILLFTTFGKENYREIYHVLGKTLHYYSVKELTELFKDYDRELDEEIRISAFGTPLDVLKHIKYTGVNALHNEKWTKKDLKNFEAGYNNFCSNRPTLTYNPIYVKLQNKN